MIPSFSSFSNTLNRRWSWTGWFGPCTGTSSILQRTPLHPSNNWDILFCKCLGAEPAEVTPKGKRLKQYLPKGVINVVRGRDSGDSGICQKQELALSLLKILAPESCASVWSTPGRGWFSRRMFSFSLHVVRPTQMQTCPFGFGNNNGDQVQGLNCRATKKGLACSLNDENFLFSGLVVFLYGTSKGSKEFERVLSGTVKDFP